MTLLDAALAGTIVALVCYRLGWYCGAVGMSRALHGKPRGIARLSTWWTARKAQDPTESEMSEGMEVLAKRLAEIRGAAVDEDRGTGQYL